MHQINGVFCEVDANDDPLKRDKSCSSDHSLLTPLVSGEQLNESVDQQGKGGGM